MFHWRTCLASGFRYLTPERLLADLTPDELDDLRTFYELEPWGGPVDDHRAALIAWAGMQPHAGKRKLTPEQFIPRWGPQDPLSPAEYRAKRMRGRG